ncbi:Clathrin light chain [Coemansia sp. RSA 2599]|nr:Clathrin light chain [Coemansia sp. RSA 2598]KAJ1821183.1 Clathrin light chain [Coemansia sp. RSA 2599]
MFVPPEAPMSPPETYAQAATSQTTMEEQYSSLKIASPSATPEASEFQKEWQSKNQGLIEQRDRQSQGRHEEVVAEAKEAMDKFYAEYNERRDRAVKENRNSQEIEVQSASKGNLWERVWKQIDLATRAAVPQESLKKTQAGGLGASPFAQRPAATQLQPQQPQQQQQVGSRDTSRMRELLQDLKRDENAPGVKPRKTESAA